METEPVIDKLRISMREVNDSVRGLPSDVLRFKPGLEKWCVLEIVCHLLDCERFIFHERLSRLLAEQNPYFPDVDHLPWVSEHHYLEQDFAKVLHELQTERDATIALAQSVPPEKWELAGTHETRGRRTFGDIAQACADHMFTHVAQIHRTVAAQRSAREK